MVSKVPPTPDVNLPYELREKMESAALRLRKPPTLSEDILWQRLRDAQLGGCVFVREAAIGPFLLDFYCPERQLAIEVNGEHQPENADAEALRQQLVNSLGIRLMHLTAVEVAHDLLATLDAIRAALG